MAGSSANWYKIGGGVKGSVYISTATVMARYPGMTGKDARAAIREDGLPESTLRGLGGMSPQPAGQAKAKAQVVTVPQRSAADRAALEDRIIANVQSASTFQNLSASEIQTKVLGVMRQILNDTEVAMRVPSATLTKILASGTFLNQHQTGTSNGTLDPAKRASAEAKMFGLDPNGAPNSFPLYGYMELRDGVLNGDQSVYGSVIVRMKPAVADRSTISAGDSLYAGGLNQLYPSPISDPTLAAADNNAKALLRYDGQPTAKIATDALDYMEVQIHGQTTVSDIASISFHATELPDAATIARLNALNIPWSVRA
jgi:hypothetical protein